MNSEEIILSNYCKAIWGSDFDLRIFKTKDTEYIEYWINVCCLNEYVSTFEVRLLPDYPDYTAVLSWDWRDLL